MKYFIPLSIATACITSFAVAQPTLQSTQNSANAVVREAPLPETIWFSAEGSHYYITTGCLPNSGLAWYSQRWGGKLLKTSAANAAGELRLKEDKTFTPAFALSQKEKGGNGTVGFTGAAEFTLESVKATSAGGVVTISWEASTAAGQPVVFEVLKAAPGAAFSVAGSYRAAAANTTETFTFTERSLQGGTQYRIRVRNEAAGERYLTRSLLQKAGRNGVAIYPTVVKDVLTINAGESVPAHYTITAADGKTVAQGVLEAGAQTLSLSTLTSGNYLVSVNGEGGISTAKIIKE